MSLIVIVSSLTVIATADTGYGYLVASEFIPANSGKDVSDDIQKLIDERGLESLSPALRDPALLRLAHPDVSLRELGELAEPPLSKSAVYHRIRRIEAIAEEAR